VRILGLPYPESNKKARFLWRALQNLVLERFMNAGLQQFYFPALGLLIFF
jgi:hypothetical protein